MSEDVRGPPYKWTIEKDGQEVRYTREFFSLIIETEYTINGMNVTGPKLKN